MIATSPIQQPAACSDDLLLEPASVSLESEATPSIVGFSCFPNINVEHNTFSCCLTYPRCHDRGGYWHNVTYIPFRLLSLLSKLVIFLKITNFKAKHSDIPSGIVFGRICWVILMCANRKSGIKVLFTVSCQQSIVSCPFSAFI